MSLWTTIKTWATSRTPVHHEIFHCPSCGSEISRYAGGPGMRGIYTRWTDLEIRARCPVHGRPPWNDRTVRASEGDRRFPR